MTKQLRNRRMVVARHGGPDVLELAHDPMPEPKAGEVRVKILAAGVSAFDLMYRRWRWLPGSPAVPFALGEDVVGEVDKLGPGVGSLAVGQLVAGWTAALGVGGGYAEFVCLPASELVAVSPNVDPAQAVCVVVNYLTAHQHLHSIGRARAGERLLVHGAAGGVGTAVIELGKLAGLEMYGTASGKNLEVVASLGAVPIDYKREDFLTRIRELTGDGVDIVIDPVGGAEHLLRSYRALRRGGRLVWLGSAATETQGLRVGPLSMLTMMILRHLPDGKSAPKCPVVDAFAEANPSWYRNTLWDLLSDLATRKIDPRIAERVPLREAARAHRLLERGDHAGKIVLVTDAYEEFAQDEVRLKRG